MNDMTPIVDAPLYRQIYDRVRTAIAERQLRPGDRLPSARSYAQELGVARGTVDFAYAMLSGEGYVETRGRAGTVVAGGAAGLAGNRIPPPSPGLDAVSDAFHRHSLLPLAPGVPAYDLFPRTAWARAIRRHAGAIGRAELTYPDPQGSLALRRAIASYLRVARGIACSADEVVITGGFQAALGLVMRVLLSPGDRMWVEDPGYSMVGQAARQAGLVPIMVDVDAHGLQVDLAIDRAPDARLAVVAPAHQFPMGVSLSLARRCQLLEWAAESGSWILEDDFDGEFRYAGKPLPALKSLDRQGRVLYAGTFSKTFFPGLRLGYLVIPPSELATVRAALRYFDGGRATLEQKVVADFVANGQFARHVRKMREAYRRRRAAMADALGRQFGPAAVEQGSGGLHLMLRVQGGLGRIGTLQVGDGAALGALPMRILTARAEYHDRLIVGFTNAAERQAPLLAGQLFAALADDPARKDPNR